jgi:thiamine pyrophosphokinase
LRVVIFSNGNISNYKNINSYIHNDDFIICCDGGLRHVDNIGLNPKVIMGDLDSVDPELLKKYENNNTDIKQFPAKKDLTDTEIAIEYAINLQCEDILLFGALGGRMDHSLANINLLYYSLNRGIKTILITETEVIRLIDKSITMCGKIGDVVSLLPFSGNVTGISTKGLEYSLNNETLLLGSVRGISNVFIDDIVEITIFSGLLLVIKTFEK